MKWLDEFRAFILRGNVIDLAIAVVIGAAFGAVVASFVADLITPLIAAIFGKPDFGGLTFEINGSVFHYGAFLNALITFLTVAAVIFFLVVKPMNALMARMGRGAEAEDAQPRVPLLHEQHPRHRDEVRLLHVRGRASHTRASRLIA